ncbi:MULTISPECIES: DUF4190 domain-containing protein [unclassified Bacillus (in: firmicutes)]|uniref:DUF4190 domain-containing protein n=1 Tax=unclassified Bacillus (in: firmicutes) TaxID=185979 RepID=UPI00203644BA|nr:MULTISPECIES: DUF4190 domain-containing protein [unclassified Bacillus (in: firmicutes)]
MADERDTKVQEALQSANIGQDIPNSPTTYREETASEIAAPIKAHYTLKKDDNNPNIGASVPMRSSEYREETAAEIAAPVPLIRRKEQTGQKENAAGGTGLGTLALVLSILSLFVLPILFGAAGIVLGFVARRRGATGLGAWAIGIGAISIVIGIFILPFF